MSELSPFHRAWVEVSPAAIESNARTLLSQLKPGTQLMAVVKADGYGHGAVTVAVAALRGGASSLGVATLQEGLELRTAGINAPILLLSALHSADELTRCHAFGLMPTLSSLEEASLCERISAEKGGDPFPVQLKVDTGMSRLGADWRVGAELVQSIRAMPSLQLVGLYSHLACADVEDVATTRLQHDRLNAVINALPDKGRTLCCHLANSAGTLHGHELHLDMVRVGLALYGQRPARHLGAELRLEPALAVRARVSLLRDVPAGTGVSYGHGYITREASRLAVVAIGYADGVIRALSGRIHALHRGSPLPQVGAITMDQIVLDASEHPDLKIGDTVTLLGRDGEASIEPQEWARQCDSITWEILCGFRKRLPRVEV